MKLWCSSRHRLVLVTLAHTLLRLAVCPANALTIGTSSDKCYERAVRKSDGILQDGEYPWFVAVVDEDDVLLCSGALVGQRLVLTSDLCAEHHLAHAVVVGYRCNVPYENCGHSNERIGIDSTYFESGVGLIVLKRNQRTLSPSEIATPDIFGALVLKKKSPMVFVGGGRSEDSYGRRPVQKQTVQFCGRKTCAKLGFRDLCFAPVCGGPCPGDGGGPVVANFKGRDLVLGVLTTSPGFLPFGCGSNRTMLEGYSTVKSATQMILSVACSSATTNAESWCPRSGFILRGPSRRIDREEYLWFTAIRRHRDGRFVCGGSLIGSRYVITADHCVASPRSVTVDVSYFCQYENNCGREHDLVAVKEVYRHPSGGDMALLVLLRAVKLTATVRPAMPYLGPPLQRRLKKHRKMALIGAGRAGTFNDLSETVEELQVQHLPTKKCKKKLQSLSLDEFMVCSVEREGGGSPCAGDSGGAVIVPGRGKWSGRDIVLAIHSHGPRDCSAAAAGARQDHTLVHFRMKHAKSLLLMVICRGDFPEDWCADAVKPQPQQSVCHCNGSSVGTFETDQSSSENGDGNDDDTENDKDDLDDGNGSGPDGMDDTSPLKNCMQDDDVDVEFVLDSDKPDIVKKCRWLRNLRRLLVYCASAKSNAKTKCPARCDLNCK